MWDLQGRRALVSGGGTGIGLACAQALTRAGAHVTVLGRREAPLRAAVASGAATEALVGDAGAPPSITDCDILVNAAGSALAAPFLRTDDAAFRAAIDANLMSAVTLTRLLLPAMIASGFGRVIHIASTAALKGYAYVVPYVAAKHALLGFTRALALEVATRGVTINAVCPGFTETPLLEASVARIEATTGRDAGTARAGLANNNPQGRLFSPEEVADAVLYLCHAPGVNGVALSLSGGEI